MTYKIETQEGNIAKLDITIDAKTAQDTYNKTLKRIGSNVNIAGFRKGKAPQNVVEKYVGTDRVKTEVIENLFPQEFSKIVQEAKLDLATQPYIESFDFELGSDLKMVVKAELKPEVDLGEYKNQTIEYEEFKNDPDALNKELKSLQERFATLVEVKDRKTNNTDTVVFDFDGYANGEQIEHGAAKNYTLDLGNSNFIPGFAEGLVDHALGEEFSINVKFPENYHEPKLKGADAEFKIKIHEIKEKVLPPIDDELAKKAGKFDSLDALKEDIQKYLDETQKLENDKRKTDAIFNKVLNDAKVEIQETMISREIDAIKEEAKQNAARQGQDFDKLVEAEGADEANKKFREEAIRRIKNSLIVEKISKTEDIKIEQKDIFDQINEIARVYGATGAQLFEEMRKNPSSFSVITQQVATKKVSDLLLNNNTFQAK